MVAFDLASLSANTHFNKYLIITIMTHWELGLYGLRRSVANSNQHDLREVNHL